MGVVKNLMVRIGADVRGLVGGMKSASSATREAKGNIQKDSGSIKNTVKGAFSGANNSVRAYAETMKNTRRAHEVAKQNVTRLTDKVSQMKGVYTTVKTATAGLDLAKPLSEQMVDAEKALTEIEHKRRKIEKELASITSPKAASSKRTEKLQTELNKLAQKSKMAEARLDSLDRVAEKLGDENMGYASASGLEKLRQEIERTENELKTTKMVAEETDGKLKEMGSVRGYAVGKTLGDIGRGLKGIGSAALQGTLTAIKGIGRAAGTMALRGVNALGTGLKNLARITLSATVNGVRKLAGLLASLAGSALRGIGSLPGKFLRIGKSAEGGSGGVRKLVQQIRNIGIVSLGMKVATGMFGQLRSIISSYISSNEELSAATSMLKNQLGQALEPAIRLVIKAMQNLLPIAQKVSAAINSVLKAIIGDIGDVQYAFRKLGTYGFDQITKADDEEEDGETEQEQSALVRKLTEWIEQLKAAFAAGNWENLGALIGEGINNAFNAITTIDLGGKVGAFVNNLATTLNSALKTIDFAGMGGALAGGINDLFGAVDWALVGETVANALLALPTIAVAAIAETNWNLIGSAVSDCMRSALDKATEWIHATDWLQVGNAISVFVKSTDWGGIAASFFDLLSAAFFAVDFTSIGTNVATMLNDVMADVDWKEVGRTIGKALTALPDILVGFVLETDWQKVGDTVSELIIGTLDYITQWFRETDFLEIGKNVLTFIEATNWAGIANSLRGLFSLEVKSLDFTDLGKSIIGNLNSAIKNASWGSIGTTVAELFNDVLGKLDYALTEFEWDGLISGLTEELNAVINGVDWEKIGTTLSAYTTTTLSGISAAVSTFDWPSLGSGIAEAINGLDWDGIASELGSGLSDAAIGALDFLIGFIEELDWGNLATELMNFGRNALDDVDWSGLVKRCFELLGSAIAGLSSFIASQWTAAFDAWIDAAGDVAAYFEPWISACGGDVISGFLLGIAAGVANIYNWIKENIWDPFIKGFKDAFGIASPSTKMKEQGGFITDGLLNGIKEKFGGIKTWVTDNLWKPFKKAFTDTFEDLEDAVEDIFDGVKNAIKTPINGILGFINSMVSGVCNGINTMIDALNAINVEVPDLAIFGDMRGKTFGFNIPKITAPKIPLLAEGTVVDGPTLAVVGEQGKEAVVPLENHTEWIDKVADKVSTRVSGGGGGNQPMIVQVYLGKRKLTEYVIQDINQITKSTGVCPIKV